MSRWEPDALLFTTGHRPIKDPKDWSGIEKINKPPLLSRLGEHVDVHSHCLMMARGGVKVEASRLDRCKLPEREDWNDSGVRHLGARR
jgi:hypothetical protein